MIRKLAVFLIVSIVLAGGYLVLTYANFYNNIGEKNLQSPFNQNIFTLVNPQKEGIVKYVALGDSLTAGVGSDDIKLTLVYQMALNLSKQFGRVDVVNLAQPGATSEDLIVDQLAVAINEKPDHVTLLIGINDIHNKVRVTDYKNRLSYTLDELLTKTSAQIILINLPYLGASDVIPFPFSNILDARTKQFNKVIEELGHNDRIKLIDLYIPSRQPFSENLSYYASDHFHPSSEGYMFWGKVINAD